MDKLKIYKREHIQNLVVRREGEIKLGERVELYPDETISVETLKSCSARFVLLGIPEDIGVRANAGLAGAGSSWIPALTSFLNTQHNRFLDGSKVLVLGHFIIEEPVEGSLDSLRKKVGAIDRLVFPIIEKIVLSGKIPVVVGGGHNNAYPIIKGFARGKGNAIDVLNIDAHADLRPMEGRHSGNGFSYAIQEDYLRKYFIYGLHQSYNNEHILNEIDRHDQISAVFFDDLLKGRHPDFLDNLPDTIGLEIDLDSIQHVLSSAETPSGFTLNDVRKLILTTKSKFSYLHLSEGALRMEDGRVDKSTAKLIAYLLSDFVKS